MAPHATSVRGHAWRALLLVSLTATAVILSLVCNLDTSGHSISATRDNSSATATLIDRTARASVAAPARHPTEVVRPALPGAVTKVAPDQASAVSIQRPEIQTQSAHRLQQLSDADFLVRLNALEHLADSGNADRVADIVPALFDAQIEVRTAAIDALEALGDDNAAAALSLALSDAAPDVRESAVDALGEIGSEMALALLQAALQDDAVAVRMAAAEWLGESGSWLSDSTPSGSTH